MLTIGQPAPFFSAKAVLDGGEVKEISLDQFKGRWLVLFFYPLNFTFVCPTEMLQFRDSIQMFNDEEADIVGCSVDSQHSHKRWIREDLNDLHFPLLSDMTKSISRDYGVLLEKDGFATRGTFIIDPEGKVQYISINNTKVGRDVNEIHRVLSALRTGELCPAGWKPGHPHIVS